MKYKITNTDLDPLSLPVATLKGHGWKDPNKAKEYERVRHLKRYYGLTPEEFNLLFDNQGKKCACCNRLEHNGKNWHIDHDHTTGKIRGILCNNCNLSIGYNGDSLENVEKALEQQVAYLRRNK